MFIGPMKVYTCPKLIVQPAWLWYSFPEVRIRKETEIGLSETQNCLVNLNDVTQAGVDRCWCSWHLIIIYQSTGKTKRSLYHDYPTKTTGRRQNDVFSFCKLRIPSGLIPTLIKTSSLLSWWPTKTTNKSWYFHHSCVLHHIINISFIWYLC